MKAAFEEFLNGRLFIPMSLVGLCESFFSTAAQGQMNFEMYSLYPVPGRERADFWDAAGKAAHDQLPKILIKIDEAARAIIHEQNDVEL